MAQSWKLDTNDSISFDEFVEFFQARGAAPLRGELDEAALMMRKLANNRTFLVERINAHLKELDSFQVKNFYTPQIFLLHFEKNFFIRTNIWVPASGRPGEQMFLYEEAHDHNFSFLTVGYLGSGYRTRIYEYNRDDVLGYAGEECSAPFLEETTLPFGKVMLFRSGRDVHTQYPPDDMSISINVMQQVPDPAPDQYVFNMQSQRLTAKINTTPGILPIRLAGLLGDEESDGLLTELMSSHPARRLRMAARDALAVRRGSAAWEGGLGDPDPLVRWTAQQRLSGKTL